MRNLIQPAPIDEKNICGSFILDELEYKYGDIVFKEVGKRVYVTFFNATTAIQVSWLNNTNFISIYSYEMTAVYDVEDFLVELLSNEFKVQRRDGSFMNMPNERIISFYQKKS